MKKLVSFIDKEDQMILTLKCGCSGELVCETHTQITIAYPPVLEPDNFKKAVAQFSTNKETESGAPDGGLIHIPIEDLLLFADKLSEICDRARKQKIQK